MTTTNSTEDYLKAVAIMMASDRPSKYSCYEDFVLQHGRQFQRIGKMPRSFKMGRAKQCFMNAARLSLSFPSLIYCEGYAVGVIPVLHGWCVTRRGTVIDPTWHDGKDYFGIPIKHSYLINSMATHNVYGVIDIPRFPIMNAKPSEFKEQL